LVWFGKTKEQEAEDGFTVHAGMAETSSVLYLVPQFVDAGYKDAVPVTGKDMESLIKIGKRQDWPGYFGSQCLDYSKIVLGIIDVKINADTIQRFGDFIKESKADVMPDSLSLKEESKRKALQETWLRKKGFN
jgi:hypothetical protein